MPACTICQHPQRLDIDKACLEDVPHRRIAKQFHVSEPAVLRHKANHLLPLLVKAHKAKEAANADKLMSHTDRYRRKLERTWERAEATGDLRSEIGAANGLARQVELMAKLEGRIDSRPVINIWLQPEWLTLQTAILAALDPYIDAKLAVAQALKRAKRATPARVVESEAAS